MMTNFIKQPEKSKSNLSKAIHGWWFMPIVLALFKEEVRGTGI